MNTLNNTPRLNCQICGAQLKELYAYTWSGYAVFECTKCNFAARKDIPDQEKIQKLYGAGYMEHLKTGQNKTGRLIRQCEEKNTKHKKQFLELINMEKRLRRLYNKKIFDVGFGMGEFLQIFSDFGFRADGCEISQECMANQAQGGFGKLWLSFFENIELKPCSYGVIVMSSVIEHFADPKRVLEKAFEALEPGGYIILMGANFNSWNRKMNGSDWVGFTHGHFYFFSPYAILKLLRQIGFSNIVFNHPENYGFFSHKKLAAYLIKKFILFLRRGPLIQRTNKFFLIAQKPLTATRLAL